MNREKALEPEIFPELVLLFCSYAQTKLVSSSGRDVAQRQRGLDSLVRELDLPQAKTEGVFQISKIRIRFILKRNCLRATLSVTADAAPPSSRRKASFSLSFCGGEQGKLAAMKAQFAFRLQAAEFGG